MNNLRSEFITAFSERPGLGKRTELLKYCQNNDLNFFELALNFLNNESDSQKVGLFKTIVSDKKDDDSAEDKLTWETII